MARLEVNPQSPLQRFKRQVEANKVSKRGQLLQNSDDASTRFNEQFKRHSQTINQGFERSKENSRNDVLQRLIDARQNQVGLQSSQTSLQDMLAGLGAHGPPPVGLSSGTSGMMGMGQGGMGYVVQNGKAHSSDPNEQWLMDRESFGGDPTADNPNSTAFGIGQLLRSNRESYGARFGFDPDTTDINEQMTMFRAYVEDRYGSMEAARRFHEQHGWY